LTARKRRSIPAALRHGLKVLCEPAPKWSTRLPADSIPFLEIWACFVEEEWLRRFPRKCLVDRSLSPAAQNQFKRQVLASISDLGVTALQLAFRENLILRDPSQFFRLESPKSRRRYREFVQTLKAGLLADMLSAFPVLSDLIASKLSQSAQNIELIVRRLHCDLQEIQNALGLQELKPHILDIQVNLSDPHEEGQAVCSLTLANPYGVEAKQIRLYYKPKNLASDVIFAKFIGFLNQSGLPHKLRTPRVVARDSYGWAEAVPHRPCNSDDELRRFYYRAGSMVALVYALRGNDIHHENLVASGEWPVVVDTETLFHPTSRRNARDDSSLFTALTTGLLPVWQFRRDGSAIDSSGLGFASDRFIGVTVRALCGINTDAMRWQRRAVSGPIRGDKSSVIGPSKSIEGYESELLGGFRRAYGLLMRHGTNLVSRFLSPARTAKLPIRVILRPTAEYGMLLRFLCHPQHLRSQRRFVAEALKTLRNRPAFALRNRDEGVLAAEVSALLHGDIPKFQTYFRSAAVYYRGSRVGKKNVFNAPFKELRAQLARLTPEDCERQCCYIRTALQTRHSSHSGKAASVTKATKSHADSKINRVSRIGLQGYIHSAEEIADVIWRQACGARTSSPTWMTVGLAPKIDRCRIQPMGLDLYAGRAGVALFLAALYAVTGEARYQGQAVAALGVDARGRLDSLSLDQLTLSGIGIGVGVGSLAYALRKIGQLTGDQHMLALSRSVLSRITLKSIEQDSQMDVLGGTPGALLAACVFLKEDREDSILELADSCKSAILRKVLAPRQHREHSVKFNRLGLAHGAAGIAYSLCRLYELIADDRLREGAALLLSEESGKYSASHGNWLDTRYEESSRAYEANAWCNGGCGIGIARLGCLNALGSSAVLRDITRSLHLTERRGVAACDHVCCGEGGNLELLLLSSEMFGSQRLASTLHTRAMAVMRRASKRDGFALPFPMRDAGFFMGLSGIGYQLLRLARPDILPSILLFQ
jgi:type 2 lantibiotic biosynthesis protein LanM